MLGPRNTITSIWNPISRTGKFIFTPKPLDPGKIGVSRGFPFVESKSSPKLHEQHQIKDFQALNTTYQDTYLYIQYIYMVCFLNGLTHVFGQYGGLITFDMSHSLFGIITVPKTFTSSEIGPEPSALIP